MKPSPILYSPPRIVISKEIDISRAMGHYVIRDPIDSSNLLYLTSKEYFKMVTVAMSNDSVLVVLASPGDYIRPPSESDESNGANAPRGSDDKGDGGAHGPSNSDSHNPWLFSFETLGLSEEVSNRLGFIQNKLREGHRSFLSKPTLFNLKTSESYLIVSDRNIGKLLTKWGALLLIRLGFPLSSFLVRQALLVMTPIWIRVFQTRGVLSMVRRIKVALHVIISFLAGNPISDTRFLGEPLAITNGLPSFLPLPVRQGIRDGSVSIIRWTLSLINAYKALDTEGKPPAFETIKNTPYLGDVSEIVSFMPRFVKGLFGPSIRFPSLSGSLTDKICVPFSVKSGPNSSIGPIGAILDVIAWFRSDPGILIEWFRATKQVALFGAFVSTLSRFHSALRYMQTSYRCRAPHPMELDSSHRGLRELYKLLCSLYGFKSKFGKLGPEQWFNALSLGKLALKQEPAGKTRVFALVDWWTQASLYPLHRYLFQLLRKLPMDGTFDQDAAVSSFAAEYQQSNLYSYDLSAATDNIPVKLTQGILAYLLGPKIARLWFQLLVLRDFKVPAGTILPEGSSIRYGRGQPIGALSSWAALALTHHVIVQLAANRVGSFPFYGYRVLGDDIVIAGELVALSYVKVCKDFEIPLNNKGILSVPGNPMRGSLTHFANQVVVGDLHLSPISFREELGLTTLAQRATSLSRLVSRGILKWNEKSFLTSIIRGSSSRFKSSISILEMLSRREFPDAAKALLASLFVNGWTLSSAPKLSESLTRSTYPETGGVLSSLLVLGASSVPQFTKRGALLRQAPLTLVECSQWAEVLRPVGLEVNRLLKLLRVQYDHDQLVLGDSYFSIMSRRFSASDFIGSASCFPQDIQGEGPPMVHMEKWILLSPEEKIAFLNQDVYRLLRCHSPAQVSDPVVLVQDLMSHMDKVGGSAQVMLTACLLEGDFTLLEKRLTPYPAYRGIQFPIHKVPLIRKWIDLYPQHFPAEPYDFTLGDLINFWGTILTFQADLVTLERPSGIVGFQQYLFDQAALGRRDPEGEDHPMYSGSGKDPTLQLQSQLWTLMSTPKPTSMGDHTPGSI